MTQNSALPQGPDSVDVGEIHEWITTARSLSTFADLNRLSDRDLICAIGAILIKSPKWELSSLSVLLVAIEAKRKAE